MCFNRNIKKNFHQKLSIKEEHLIIKRQNKNQEVIIKKLMTQLIYFNLKLYLNLEANNFFKRNKIY